MHLWLWLDGIWLQAPHLPPAGCQSAKPFLLPAPFPLSHRPHWLTVELGFSVTDRLFLKAPSFIRRDRKNGETTDRKLGFQPSSPCTTCLVSDLNTGRDLDLPELVSLFSFLFFFVCDRSMCVQVGRTMGKGLPGITQSRLVSCRPGQPLKAPFLQTKPNQQTKRCAQDCQVCGDANKLGPDSCRLGFGTFYRRKKHGGLHYGR